jgi:CDP-diacylglycerol pyrophosphatase
MTRLRSITGLIIGLAVLVCAAPAGSSDSAVLWRVVRDFCVTDMKLTGHPAPCLEVNRQAGWAVLKVPGERTQVLLVPTTRVPGIESPKLLAPDGPNYWQAAWDARRWVERRAGMSIPREKIGLAINSIYGRSQDQLHIHVDCARGDVIAKLKAHEDEIGPVWAPLPVKLGDRYYRAMRLSGAELGERDPFKILAAESPQVRAAMGRQTLIVIGSADGSPGFVLLAAEGGRSDNPDGHGEELLDHHCADLRRAP